MKPLAPNTMIQNRYLVVQAIGKGGMGEVYLAVDQRLGSAVALKRTFFNDDNLLGSAFEREARILARLRHPVLPKVIDHFAENGDQFLVMEHISGDDLSKRLENAKKPFPVSWVMFWADQMLDALSYLHSHEPPIVHRDIKPQNLKLTDENHIVLLDFGLSKDFDTSATGNPLNSASVAGYSPHFASMEQIRGTGTDARSDIYSLSATLYQMLTNSIPIDALSRADAILGGGKDCIEPLNIINPDVSPAVSDVILKGLELRQDARFLTAAEMQKALRRAFNKGNSPEDPKTLPAVGEAKPPRNEQDSGPSEMAKRTQEDISSLSMEATLHMDALPQIEEVKQSEIKTEVFSAPATPLSEQASEPEEPTRMRTPEIARAAMAAAATAPPANPVQPPAAVPAGKKSSKTGLIIGVLIGLIMLGGIAAGGGWYAYSKFFAEANTAATPTPMPSASPVPSGTVMAESGQNSVSNSNTTAINDTNTEVTNSGSTPAPQTTNPAATRSTPPAVTTKSARPKAAPPPAAKATPKPKAEDERKVILQ